MTIPRLLLVLTLVFSASGLLAQSICTDESICEMPLSEAVDHREHLTFSAAGDPELGEYGYRHNELHELGTIDLLMKLNRTSCCDGGEGGECRVTKLRHNPESNDQEAWLNGRWCRLTTIVYNGLPLPVDAEAVVCASGSYSGSCPHTYCAGANHQM